MRTTATTISGRTTEPTLVCHDTLPEVSPEARELPVTSEPESSQNPPQDVHNHGDLHAAFSTMTATMVRLVNRVSELEKSSNPLAKVVTVPQVTIPGHLIYYAESCSRYTLETAMFAQPRHHNSDTRIHRHSASSSNITDLSHQPGIMNGLQSPQIQGVRTEGGYSSESLPHIKLVFPLSRRKIIEGKNVNLAVLLIPHYEDAMINEERSEMYSCSTKKPDHRLNKILDLSSFMKAFGIYKSVMTEVCPQRQKELDLINKIS